MNPEGRKNGQNPSEFLAWLFEKYNKQIYGYAARMVGDRSDAEDIMQEVFLRAAGRLEGATEEKGRRWLYRVATNLAIDRLRRKRFRMASIDVTIEEKGLEAVLSSDSPTPDAVAQEMELQRELDKAIAALPPDQRQVVHLRHTAGLSFKEISEVTGWPLGTVLSRMHRAIEELRSGVGRRLGFLPGQEEAGNV